MKKILTILILLGFGISIKAQDIKEDYCELIEASAFMKTYYVIYHDDKMDGLVDEKGDKISSKMGITKALNIMSERGWEVVSVYISEKGGAKYLTYLLRKKKI